MAGYWAKRAKRVAAGKARKAKARVDTLRTELDKATGTAPRANGGLGQPALDPNAWAAKLPGGVDVRVYRGSAFLGSIEGDDLRMCVEAGEPVEALVLDTFGAGKYTLRPQIDGALRQGTRVTCGDVDSRGNLMGMEGHRVEVLEAKLEQQAERAKDRETLAALTATIVAQNGGGSGLGALGETVDVLDKLRANPVVDKLMAHTLERALNPPAPVALPAASGTDNTIDWLKFVTDVASKVTGNMASPAGAFARPGGGAAPAPGPTPPPPPPQPEATPMDPPKQVDTPADPPPDTPADPEPRVVSGPVDLSVHTTSKLEELPEDIAAVAISHVKGIQQAAHERNAPVMVETLYRLMDLKETAGVPGNQMEMLEQHPAEAIDDLAQYIDVDPETLAAAREIVVADMAERVRQREADQDADPVAPDTTTTELVTDVAGG